MINAIKNELKEIKEAPGDLRKFGVTVGAILLLAGVYLFWEKEPAFIYFAVSGGTLVLTGFILPEILKPLNKAWMALAVVLGWIMTRVILSLLFYLVVTPVSFIARMVGKDFLSLKLEKGKETYWIKRETVKKQPQDYERQF